tara:strand:+ start:707 stop:1318 length:612 start_codon:yes stop_codon:yes gene_type:complete
MYKTRKDNLKTYTAKYKVKIDNLFNQLDYTKLNDAVTSIINAIVSNKTIWFCGNGGSAALASHMHVDFGYFVRYFSKIRPKVRALTDCIPIISAIANDDSYENIFTEQMQGNFTEGDVIICISASGNSKNVINAANYSKDLNGTSIGFIGFEGGELLNSVDIPIYTKNPKGDYGPIEDLHSILMHLIVSYLREDDEYMNYVNS